MENAGVSYMLTGSIASSLQGEPRATHDIDVVIQIDLSDAQKLTGAFTQPGFYIDSQSAVTAIKNKDMFNALDMSEGYKIDFWMLTDEPFDKSRFSRRQIGEFAGANVYIPSPEDTILMKLRWVRLCGGSEKHFTDALRVYEVQAGILDATYMEHWANTLEVADLLERVKAEAVL